MLHLARINTPLLHVTQKILDRGVVEGCRLTLGCGHVKDLYEILSEYFNISDNSQEAATTRTLILTSVRRKLHLLLTHSTEPELLFLYDICLEDLQLTYIRDMFTLPETSLQGLHQLVIVLEALEMSGVCSEVCREYSKALEAFWNAEGEMMEMLKLVLIEVLRTFVNWKQRYRTCPVLGPDPLDLQSHLTSISDRYIQALFPVLNETLRLIDKEQGRRLYLPLNPGTAVGKVMRVHKLEEMKSGYNATIAVLEGEAGEGLPSSLQALVVVGEVPSQLLAECLERRIALAEVDSTWDAALDNKAQVIISEHCLEFL